ncbi:MAG: ABC transporter ATP-binding protein [Variibacter sp.]|uniref:ABC transporter ATP-binding protein n=1 Tax=Pseudorhodoplanes sp. TaxID=1934341 RepID=UPI003D1384ED
MALLEIENLQVHFRTLKGINRAVDGLSFSVEAGEIVAIVGESGSGKSVTSMSILRLLPESGTGIAGVIRFDGRPLRDLSEKDMQGLRGNEISMIFQEPMTALNPVLTVGYQISESLILHQHINRAAAMAKAEEMLRSVGIAEPARRLGEYPHQLSGGIRQRVMIAMALACAPRLLIADEPTTALDVTIQAQILRLIRDLKDKFGTSIIFVTHDLGVVAEVASRVIVMYAGHKLEEASTVQLFERPRHPYTVGLIGAMPILGTSLKNENWQLAEIPGSVPSTLQKAVGCVFANRCASARDVCRTVRPGMREEGDGHFYACHFPEEVGRRHDQ